jgi:hypothetical protein
MLNPKTINPAMATFTKLYPTPNITPQPENGYASSGYNWAKNVMATTTDSSFTDAWTRTFPTP